MAWFLQPANYTQVGKRNLYNVAYRRVGTYKGMGALGQGLCPGDPSCPGYVAPPSSTPDVQQQIADVWSSIFGMQTQAATPSSGSGWMPLIAGGLLLFVLFSGGRK